MIELPTDVQLLILDHVSKGVRRARCPRATNAVGRPTTALAKLKRRFTNDASLDQTSITSESIMLDK